ncbi:hypothetical protein GURASL_32210 [Geotalea uraniireducens]|uniref:Uncharacterized protein n=1 Tax=Geotalea uraniireducens TaxID=351604 RepID=A0ABM8EPA0_9BACT|nr:hypothetical protein [Geotalea uraniireducens]BDV44298.1 hypothetical protein GURASL_32210 [Geotalea uraniireducens]
MCTTLLSKKSGVSLLALSLAGVGLVFCCQLGLQRALQFKAKRLSRPAVTASLHKPRDRESGVTVALPRPSPNLPAAPCLFAMSPVRPVGIIADLFAAPAVSRGPPPAGTTLPL